MKGDEGEEDEELLLFLALLSPPASDSSGIKFN
jgi:hypothetical protein